jgi:DNA polymerase-1
MNAQGRAILDNSRHELREPAMPTTEPPGNPPNLRGWTIYLVDAHSLIFQVFHALPEMSSPRGEPVGAVFGFTRDMLYLLEQKQPDVLICAFDMPGPTFRHDLYQAYKADRREMPEALVTQIPKIRDMLAALSIPVLALPGFEADDVLATLARLCDAQQADCYVVTGDKDCRQLITDHVSIYNIRKDAVMDAMALADDWGIRPDQVVDFQALVGDKVDNVPGVPLIGPKIACELLTTYGTLDAVLDNAANVKGAKRSQNLLQSRAQALLSRQLVRLDDNVPVVPDWNAGRVGGFDHNRLDELCGEFGFRSFGDQVARMSQASAPASWDADYRLVDTPEKLREFAAEGGNRGLLVRLAARHGVLPASPRAGGRHAARPGRNGPCAPAAARRPADRQDWAEPQVRCGRAPVGWH